MVGRGIKNLSAIIIFLFGIFFASDVLAADRYWVGGAATWDNTVGSKWALTSGGAGGQAVPTASDDVYFDAASGANAIVISLYAAASNLNFTGFTGTVSVSGNFTVSSTLTISGVSATNRFFLTSNTVGTPRTITVNGTVTMSNIDFRDITATGTASWNLAVITGGSGDCGGNSNITFTAATTTYWVGGTGSWSSVGEWGTTSGGSGGRVPLPQDDVVFDVNSFNAGSQITTADMPRSGKNISFTNVTNTPQYKRSVVTVIYGSLTLVSGMTWAGSFGVTFEGRGAFTLTSAGLSSPASVTVNMVGGSLTLQDALTTLNNGSLTITNGTFDANDFNVTIIGSFVFTSSATKVINMGNGTWTLSNPNASTPLNAGSSGTTFNAEGSTINISSTASTTQKAFSGAGLTYNIFTASGDNILMSGSNTFATMNVNNAGLVVGFKLTSGTTQTITTSFTTNGSAGNLAILQSSVTSSPATLSKASGTVSVDYMSIRDSAATGGATWNAGANSTDVSGNTGWSFSASGPTIDSVVITTTTGGGAVSDIILVESATTSVYIRGQITQSNGCSNLNTSTLQSVFYRSLVTGTSVCSADTSNCYSSASGGGTCALSGCTLGTETTSTYQCIVPVQYYADPTDSGAYITQNWIGQISINDNSANSATSTSSAEVDSIAGLAFTSSSFDFGELDIFSTSTSDVVLNFMNSGNVSIDSYVSGQDFVCSRGSIPIGSQRFSTTTGSDFLNMTPVATSSALATINLPKSTSSTVSTSSIYFKLSVGSAGLQGVCTSTATISAQAH